MLEAPKQFHYETQKYQEVCVKNITDIFEKIYQNNSYKNVITNHQNQNNYNFPTVENNNIDVMMETGTGKTFTFIKTIFELNHKFGQKKFIILVPSVPIREGTKTNFEDTKNYFKTIYANAREKEIETFVYESGNISAVKQFINTSHLSVLVMTPSSFDKDKNVLNRALEHEVHTPELFITNTEPPKSYLDCLKRLNPIIIMDEPHRFEGDAFKKYFEGFTNYYIRYGATFPKKKDSLQLSNVAYVLDSISSFRQNLVKKIIVYTQDVAQNADTLIAIENKKVKINTLSNGVIIPREVGIGGLFNLKTIVKINKDSIVLSDNSIEKIDYSLTDDAIRAMIAQTIEIHFQKEKELFLQGIKALTLFFMTNDISLFRGENPKIKIIFEEEFIKQRQLIIANLQPNDPYKAYLEYDFDGDNQLHVHKGYFSGDKGTNDDKVKAGVNEILKDKKKLLSFESSTRFIFSIWALQEGWDNPNVFTICKLSNQGSEISKLQQIGRGLRICVNQNLQRLTLNALQDNQQTFWKINNLDVIVSNKEQGFVEAIQNEILNNSYLIAPNFTLQELKKTLQDNSDLEDNVIRKLSRMLEDNELIVFKALVNGVDIFEKAPDFNKLLKEQNIPEEQYKALENIFATDIQGYITNAKNNKTKKKIFIKEKHLFEFQNLWNTINKNAFFVLENLSETEENQLIHNIKSEIEALNINENFLQTIKAELHVNKLGNDDAISKQLTNSIAYKNKIDYIQLVQNLSNVTKTPITFVIKICNALSTEFKNTMITNNPALAQNEIATIIKNHLVSLIKTNVRYDGIDGTVLPNIFKTENQKTYLAEGTVGKFQKEITDDFHLKEKWVFEEVIEYDSNFELEIVEQDPDIASIEIFGKLPKLNIETPLGKYSPDFCYLIKSNNGNKLFLIVESKGYHTSTAIPTDEKAKIDFAKKYFDALNLYYQNQNIKISFKERINRTQLVALISTE